MIEESEQQAMQNKSETLLAERDLTPEQIDFLENEANQIRIEYLSQEELLVVYKVDT
jgi:hypothetical protein